MASNQTWRKTTQRVPPAQVGDRPDRYDIYPAFPIGPGKIDRGFDALARRISEQPVVVLDGFGGVLWDILRDNLAASLAKLDIDATWIGLDTALRQPAEIDELIAPYLGGDDPLFGTRCPLDLVSFFVPERLAQIRHHASTVTGPTLIYGTGSTLAAPDNSFLVYVDVPKDEIQFRSRAGSIHNLGAAEPSAAKPMYKRFYFVDWPVLGRHKEALLPKVDLFVDGQWPGDVTFIDGDDLHGGLESMSASFFRVRPWFEPGPWGGHWIEGNLPDLPRDVPNYAWSFELIVPENGLAFESGGLLFEVSFDALMFAHKDRVLGKWAPVFGNEFPIRFDWLDTIGGGNLSVQCHPRPDYIRRHFGETFTQDETYYIMDCKPDAEVYLGFKDGIDPAEFRAELERSFRDAVPADIDRFVAKWPAEKHDLFLIPSGTIHCSGADNMVLEISATPYIFTFKMYDWMRLDLDGRPRPLNIDRALENLYFDRQGDRVRQELISVPRTVDEGAGWRIVHLPTHPDHFYDIHRLEIDAEVEISTDDGPHVLALVEGTAVTLVVENGRSQTFHYAETFVVPAAAGSYRIVNAGDGQAKLVRASIRRPFS